MLTGIIIPPETKTEGAVERARKLLKGLGVRVGYYNAYLGEFQNCKVDDEAMKKLDPLWGTFIWVLTPEST